MTDRKGVVAMHAYSVMEAREVEGQRLLKLRNPWGKSEWKGAWSDGSAEWTPEWMARLNHKFGDDGVFWMSYDDLRRKFSEFDRTRLFNDPSWKVSQQWAAVDVPWSAEYSTTKFEVQVKQAGRCVIVLSQLDDRYFKGLEGQYQFELQFRIENNDEEGYIVRSNETYFMQRSCNVELDLEPGTYTVLIKVDADRFENDKSPEHVIRETFKTKRNKLLQIGLAYDLAHAKAIPYESPEDVAAREAREKAEKAAAKARAKREKRDLNWADWEREMREFLRKQRRKERTKRHQEKKEKQKQAEREVQGSSKETDAVETKTEKSGQRQKDNEEKTASKSTDNSTEDINSTAETSKKEEPNKTKPSSAVQVEQELKTTNKEESKEPKSSDSVQGEQEAATSATTEAKEQIKVPFADAEAKIKDLMAQAEAIMAQARNASNAESTNTAPRPADVPHGIDTSNAPDVQSETVPTPTTSKDSSEADKSEAPVPPAAPVPATAPAPPPAPEVPELLLPNNADADDNASVRSSSSITSVASWATSIDSKLDSIDYQSDDGSTSSATGEEDPDNTPIADDPWNAVCVVGLRVFSRSDVMVRAVWPKSEQEMIDRAGEQPLDVDDISKAGSGDKSIVGSAEVHKESVDGTRPPLNQRDSYGKVAYGSRRVR